MVSRFAALDRDLLDQRLHAKAQEFKRLSAELKQAETTLEELRGSAGEAESLAIQREASLRKRQGRSAEEFVTLWKKYVARYGRWTFDRDKS